MLRQVTAVGLIVVAALLASCASSQAVFVPIGQASYPARPSDHPIDFFWDTLPERPYAEIARLNAHLEKTHLLPSTRAAAQKLLEEQARAAGADAVIRIEERREVRHETRSYNVRGIAIRYLE